MSAKLILTNGLIALVDESDFEIVCRYKWFGQRGSSGIYYAHRTSDQLSLHRFLLQPLDGMLVDHKNGDGLDNRRENIRLATVSQNQMNKCRPWGKSSFKGVTWNKNAGKWQAEIRANNQKHYLGIFSTEEEAAAAYRQAADRLHGEFARY